MKALQSLRQRITRMLTAPGEELGSWARFARFQIRLWRLCMRRLRDNNALAMSSALSFRTIFALVPTIVLTVVVLRSFGGLDSSKRTLEGFLQQSGFAKIALVSERHSQTAPATGPASRPERIINVAERIEAVVRGVEQKLTLGRIGPIGVALLIWSALTLLTTMERSLNRIFGAPRSRSVARRVMIYWSVVTLGPIVFAAALYAGGELLDLVGKAGRADWILAVLGWVQPIAAGILFLAAVYYLMPNTAVSLRAALGGAVVAFPLWLVAKWGFGIYVRDLVGGGSLYGSLGLVPLFLFWLNLSWLLFLFGAELAHTAVHLDSVPADGRREPTFLGPWELLGAAMVIARSFARGRGPGSLRQVAGELLLPDAEAAALLERLAQRGTVCPVEGAQEGVFLPARALDQIRVAEILEIAPDGPAEGARRLPGDLGRTIQRVQAQTHDALKDVTLADLLAAPPAGDAPGS